MHYNRIGGFGYGAIPCRHESGDGDGVFVKIRELRPVGIVCAFGRVVALLNGYVGDRKRGFDAVFESVALLYADRERRGRAYRANKVYFLGFAARETYALAGVAVGV